jgi:putative addiction module component (TIGR02574 family)
LRQPACPAILNLMNEQGETLLSQVLQLPVDERAELAAELLASLDREGVPDADVDAAWAKEIERRARRVLEQGSRGRTWEEVREELLRKL